MRIQKSLEEAGREDVVPHKNVFISTFSLIRQWLTGTFCVLSICLASMLSTYVPTAEAQSIKDCNSDNSFAIEYVKEISLTSMSVTFLVSLAEENSVGVSSIRNQISQPVRLGDEKDRDSGQVVTRTLITLPIRAELNKYPFLEAYVDVNILNQPQINDCAAQESLGTLEGNLRGWKHTNTEVTVKDQALNISYTLERSRIQIFFDVIFPLGALIMISVFTSLFMDVRNFERIPWKIGVQVTLLLAALFLRSSYEDLAPQNNSLMHGDVMFITCYLAITISTLFPMAFRMVIDPELPFYPAAYRAVLMLIYFTVAVCAAAAIVIVRGLL